MGMTVTAENQMTRSGFCQFPSPGSHVFCDSLELVCGCACHSDITVFDDGFRIGEVSITSPVDDVLAGAGEDDGGDAGE